MEAIKARLRPIQIQRLDEVADGMLKIYRTLVRMQYLEDSWVHEGPHDVDAFLPTWRQDGIPDSIAYLYSILPYVDSYWNRGIDFVFGGMFVNFLHAEIADYRNPMNTADNHYGALIYDARRHVIGICGIEGETQDPNYTFKDQLKTYVSDEYDEYDSDDDAPENHVWDEMKGRHAPKVLRDIVLWYKNLTQLPGGGEQSGGGSWSATLTKPLYIKHGWPHNFDGIGFLVDQVKTFAVLNAERDPKPNMLARINRFRRFLQTPPPPQQADITEHDNVEDFWYQRWRWFQDGLSRIDVPVLLQELERAYELPSDPQVRLLKKLRDGIRSREKELSSGGILEMDNRPESAQIRMAYSRKCLDIQKRAYDECKTELGGDAFFAQHNMVETDLDPDKSPNPELQERSRLHIEALRAWLVQVPQEASRAREMAEISIKDYEANL
ncbi:hypothetical protein B0T11DRAFT_313887 [Plectosphaerella cucumerina]|uniref:Uncharacterized protein n=1 Tax=Plectosphaerella cucumerina TaxID=40658 RepID=A0A8K0TSW6_9PEZI|nr:hypothetical protein B0T11DRAFT_313887 [Plectosphaerella cucumerina]